MVDTDYWYYDIGGNLIPAITKEKRSCISSWKQYQDNAISDIQYENWKKEIYLTMEWLSYRTCSIQRIRIIFLKIYLQKKLEISMLLELKIFL